MTFWDTIERGEYVMIALMVILIAILSIWIAVCRILCRQRRKDRALLHQVRDLIMEGDTESAWQTANSSNTPASRVIAAGISKIGAKNLEIKSEMAQISHLEKKKVDIGTRWLRAFAVISPLLGLAGTLVGIIDRLRVLGQADAPVDTAAICLAISPTIVTTVAGLGVGIFAIVALSCLEGCINKAKIHIEETAHQFLHLLNQPI